MQFLESCVKEDENRNVTQMIIYFPHIIENRKIEVGIEIDHFLTTRPWWLLKEEIPLHWKYRRKSSRIAKIIVLMRHDSKWENHLRWLVNVQYPPTVEACATSPLIVGHMVDAGYASFLQFYSSVKGHISFCSVLLIR